MFVSLERLTRSHTSKLQRYAVMYTWNALGRRAHLLTCSTGPQFSSDEVPEAEYITPEVLEHPQSSSHPHLFAYPLR